MRSSSVRPPHDDAARSDPRTPNLFIIGAPKAGTTFVHHALGLVPDVYMSEVKEPGYFSSPREQRRGLGYYLDAYFAQAAHHALRGESTPWYLYSDAALEAIAAMPASQPPQFLVLVRRPSARARSMYLDQVRLNREHRSFREAVAMEIELMSAGQLVDDVRQRYVWGGLYHDHIVRWREAFGPERVHVMVLEDIRSEPDRSWAELSASLRRDLGPCQFDAVGPKDRNPSGRLRWPRVDRVVRSLEGRDLWPVELAKQVLPPGFHRRVLQQLGRLNRTPSNDDVEADDATRSWLDDYFEAEVDRLEVLLRRPLPAWRGGEPHDDPGEALRAASVPGVEAEPSLAGSRPISILHLLARSHRRGAELAAVELAAELDKRGHHNRVVALGPALDGGREDGLVPLADTQGVGLREFASRVVRLRRLLDQERWDVVLAHGGWAAQIAAFAVPRRGPLLVWQRILGFPPEVWGPARRRWWRVIAGRVDIGVALTDDLELELRRLGFDKPVWVIPNSRQPDRFVDLDRASASARLRCQLEIPADVPLIGFVGHLVRQKRPERALEVVERLREMDHPCHLVIAGDGPLRESLETSVHERDLGHLVTFLGFRPDVEAVFGGVELALLTSEAEGIPGVAIEALMAGCPLVSFRVGGVDQVVEDGVTGFLIDGHDPTEMAKVVASLLADRELLTAMSAQGRLRTPRYTAAAAATIYAERLSAALTSR